jgi:hypothetical protein
VPTFGQLIRNPARCLLVGQVGRTGKNLHWF